MVLLLRGQMLLLLQMVMMMMAVIIILLLLAIKAVKVMGCSGGGVRGDCGGRGRVGAACGRNGGA